MDKLIEILNIIKKYGNFDYPIWCEHDVLGFIINPDIISKEDMKRLNELNVFYSDEYCSLIKYV